ncbi:MAG: FadR/GntR family transcriptional regulator [Burkholderiaceae bacterium]
MMNLFGHIKNSCGKSVKRYCDGASEAKGPGVEMQSGKTIRTGGKAASEPTLADKFTQLLADQLRKGVYPVNSRLPTEQAMAEEFGISRTVVREAISRLKSEGLVETRQGSGTIVLNPAASAAFRLKPDENNPAEGILRIIELRCGIEAQMAALAAERRSAADMEAIQEALKDIDNAVASGRDGVGEDLAFHMAIAQASKNPYFLDLLGMLTHALHEAIRVTRSNEARRADLTDDVRAEHAAISTAILEQDPEAARAAASRHMESTMRRIRFAEADFWTAERTLAARRLARGELKSAPAATAGNDLIS